MKPAAVCFSCVLLLLISGCSFDYGGTGSMGDDQPNMIMRGVEYTRVESTEPLARFNADYAESYEKQNVMKLQDFTFEQYGQSSEEISISGRAGQAVIEINTGDIFMDGGVSIEVKAENIVLETYRLEWRDEQRTLSTGEQDEVTIYMENGTSFTGVGLQAEARRRSWEFSGGVSGQYVLQDTEE
jgi:LPS export ABC transporter protein LptC